MNNTPDASKLGYRIGSYGFNGNVNWNRTRSDPPTNPLGGSSQAKFGPTITFVKPSADVPLFYDATWIDNIGMVNGSKTQQPRRRPIYKATLHLRVAATTTGESCSTGTCTRSTSVSPTGMPARSALKMFINYSGRRIGFVILERTCRGDNRDNMHTRSTLDR